MAAATTAAVAAATAAAMAATAAATAAAMAAAATAGSPRVCAASGCADAITVSVCGRRGAMCIDRMFVQIESPFCCLLVANLQA